MRALRRAGLGLAFLSSLAAAQSSFDSDPFSSRFKERASFDVKFKAPEQGERWKISMPDTKEGEPTGKMTMLDENVGEAEAPPGKVVLIEYQDIKLSAQRIRFDYAKRMLVAEGTVILLQGASRLTGDRVDLDMTDKVGVVQNATIDLEGGVHLKAATLTKVGPRSFTMTDGTLTACEGSPPDWSFSLKSGRVTLEEYARLKDVVFRMGTVPLLYSPYLLWPARQERASGFMIPQIGYSQTRGGYLGLSYYWAIGRSLDATFSADVYTKKFFGLGAEFRARSSTGTKLEGIFYTIRDPDFVNENGDVGAWRWQTRGTLTSDDLGPGLRGVVTWLDASDPTFFQDFSRDFTLSSTRSVRSEGFVTKTAGPVALNLRLSREEAFFGDTSVITERRPSLEARLRPTPLLGQLLFVEGEGQAGLFRVNRGPGQPSGLYDRIDLFPKVSAPVSPLPWLSAQVTGGFRLTTYGKSKEGNTLVDERFNRTYGQVGVELTGPSFARIFDLKIGPFERFKHVIEPRADYNYVSEPDDLDPSRARTPLFDEIDTISSAHTLKYGLVQRLLAKQEKGSAREIASLEISRLYSFKLPGEGTTYGPNPSLTRGGPLEATLRVNVSTAFNFDVRTTYDLANGRSTSSSLTASLSTKLQNLSLSLFDSRPFLPGIPIDASTQLRFGVGTPIIPKKLRFDMQGNYDISEGKMLETRTLLTYEGSCFKILAEYRDLRIGVTPMKDYRIGLNLKNLGSFLDFNGSF